MVIGVIVLIAFIGAIVGGGIFAYRMVKKSSDTMSGVAADTSNMNSAQQFLPFETVRDDVLDLGGFRYRMFIECTSVNYALKTDDEQSIIEMSFQRNINSFQFPFTFFIQTREIDNSKMLESLKEDTVETVKYFPLLEEYGSIYYEEMRNLTTTLQNTKQKKKYIIVPFDDAMTLTNLTKEERFDYASKELFARASMVRDSMGSLGIKAKILDTNEIIELLYSTFHKDGNNDVDGLMNGDFTSLMVEGVFQNKNTGDLLIGNRMAHTDAFEKIGLILSQSEKWIKNEVTPLLSDVEYIALIDAVIEKIEELKISTNITYTDIVNERMEGEE